MLKELIKYSGMAVAIYRHVRYPINPDPEGTIRTCMERRNDNFMAHAATLIATPGHPYHQMFQLVGCSYADLEASVRREGLEPTLEKLLREGVYLTHDEFRGKKEIVRSGRHIPASISMWNNPASKGGYVTSSSGTSGRAVATRHSVDSAWIGDSVARLCIQELNIPQSAGVSVAPILPGYGLFTVIGAARYSSGVARWYAPAGATPANRLYRILTRLFVTEMRLLGVKAPYPIYLDQNDFRPMAEYLNSQLQGGKIPAITGFVSTVARVAAAATSNGFDLTGCVAITSGEALTDAKRQVIQSSGMTVYPSYGTTDFGGIGAPCSQMNRGNCVHIFKHGIALISRKQQTAWTETPVNSLYATSILPRSARIFINAEIGDTGVIERARCDCSFSRLGFDLQVRDIAAISKVTAQGMTIEITELVPLLEEMLPARFGGHPGDYQLIEMEAGSQTEVVLRIRPGVSTAPANEIRRYFLGEVKRVYGGSMSVISWLHSGGIRAEVAPPILASTGKFRAIRLLGVPAAQTEEKLQAHSRPVSASRRMQVS